MAGLSDVSIRLAVIEKEIGIDPFIDKNIQPSSYDLTLDCSNKKDITLYPVNYYTGQAIERLVKLLLMNRISEDRPKAIADVYEAKKKNSFELLSTVEYISLPTYIQGIVHGRSSLARKGLFIHVSAGFIDPGFHGNITLECINVGPEPILLAQGDRIAQIAFTRLDRAALEPYNGRYQGQRGATESRFKHEYEEIDKLGQYLPMDAQILTKIQNTALNYNIQSNVTQKDLDNIQTAGYYLTNGDTAMAEQMDEN